MMPAGTRWSARRSRLARVALAALATVVAARWATGGADGLERTDLDPVQRLKEFKEAAASYAITREGDPPTQLQLVPDPALRWNNPLRIAYDGAVFVWVADGRPEVVACFFRNVRRGVPPMEHHEFQSLSEASLTAETRDGRMWISRQPGIALKPIPHAPAPAADPAGRLRQLRTLARQFQAGYVTEDKSRGVSLRLLPQPLHHCASTRPDQPDSAVFAFVQATDPEALLVIETRSASGTPAWQYSFARMSTRGLRGWHKDELVWEVESRFPHPRSPYVDFIKRVPPR